MGEQAIRIKEKEYYLLNDYRNLFLIETNIILDTASDVFANKIGQKELNNISKSSYHVAKNFEKFAMHSQNEYSISNENLRKIEISLINFLYDFDISVGKIKRLLYSERKFATARAVTDTYKRIKVLNNQLIYLIKKLRQRESY